MRHWVNLIKLVLLFLGLVALLSWVLSNLFASFLLLLVVDVVAFALCIFLYVQWHNRPVQIRCPACRKMVLSNTPWICGVCGHQNKETDTFSFLNECANCHAAPKAYECHHPHEQPTLIFFWEDQDSRTPARRLDSTVPHSKQRAEIVARRSESHEDKKHQIEMVRMDLVEARLNETLETIKKRMAYEPEKTDLEAHLKNLQQHMDIWTAVDEAARRQKKKNAEDFPNEPDERDRRDLIVDDWVFRKKSEGQ